MSRRIDITGQRFGRWTVLSFTVSRNNQSYWHCRCDCGTHAEVIGNHLKNGRTTSCGCYKAEAKTTHGMSDHPMYRTWAGMLSRCRNPNDAWYHRYGKIGIGVCDQWLDFANFYADVGDRPEGMTLDRIDNKLGYFPGNVRWATHKQQAQNQEPRDRMLTAFGKTRSIADWAKRLGVSPDVIHVRLHRGWPAEQAVLLPKGSRR